MWPFEISCMHDWLDYNQTDQNIVDAIAVEQDAWPSPIPSNIRPPQNVEFWYQLLFLNETSTQNPQRLDENLRRVAPFYMSILETPIFFIFVSYISNRRSHAHELFFS